MLGDLPRGLRRVPRAISGSAAGQATTEEGAAAAAPAPEFSNRVVVAGTTTTEALTATPGRRYLLIQNRGANDVYVVFGGKATVNAGVLIAASGGAYEPFVAPSSSVSVITGSGSSNVVFVEGVS